MASELLDNILDALGSRVAKRKASGEISAWCPFHPDGQGNPPHRPNLVIKPGKTAAYIWACPVCNQGGTLPKLANRLREIGIMPPRDGQKSSGGIVATYDYRDEKDQLLYQVVRKTGKKFQQRRPDGKGGWIYNLDGVSRVPYRLRELLAAPADAWVHVVEGEKDVDTLARVGLVATTNSEGAGSWREELSSQLKGRKVAILPDNDAPGQDHARDVAAKLASHATEIRIVDLPGLPLGGDVSDWLAQGHTAEELASVVEKAPNFTSNHIQEPLEVKFSREINAATLQARENDVDLPFLPLLSQEGFLVRGWSHLVAGYPKGGKTELVARLCHEWGVVGETVLYFTEEPESIWHARLSLQPQGWEHVTLVFALGMKPSEILERIRAGQETVVVIDTIRNLLGFRDEKDNSEIAQAVNPFIAAAREGDKTVLFVHHDRKGGGEHGEGITGGHAFLGVVDIALELRRDGQAKRRRQVRGWGRIIPVPELVYEMTEDGSFVALGEPGAVAFETVKERGEEVLTEEWESTKKVRELLADPKPSLEQLRQALESLAQEGRAERNPPITEGKRQGMTHKWRINNFTSNSPSIGLKVKSERGSDGRS